MSEYVCEVAFGVEVYGNGTLRDYERIEATSGFVACDMGADGFCACGVRRESE